MSIELAIAQLNEMYVERFYDRREDIVLGEGCLSPRIVIIGEAPGKDEVEKKRPFVGKAGKNLDFFLCKLGIERKDIYITNAIKYRLKKISPKSGGFINRPATTFDIASNMDILHKEVVILNPRLVVTLGNVPLKALTNDAKISIGDVHGRMTKVHIGGCALSLYPLYHPASIIYNPTLTDVYMEDIENLKAQSIFS